MAKAIPIKGTDWYLLRGNAYQVEHRILSIGAQGVTKRKGTDIEYEQPIMSRAERPASDHMLDGPHVVSYED